jgi:hypothetical protein
VCSLGCIININCRRLGSDLHRHLRRSDLFGRLLLGRRRLGSDLHRHLRRSDLFGRLLGRRRLGSDLHRHLRRSDLFGRDLDALPAAAPAATLVPSLVVLSTVEHQLQGVRVDVTRLTTARDARIQSDSARHNERSTLQRLPKSN